MKRKKLYYVPGLISIIGLPVLLFFLGPADPVENTAVKLNLSSDAKDTPGIQRFTTEAVYKTIKHKKLISVEIAGVDEDDADYYPAYNQEVYINNEKLDFIRREIERFQFTHDTTVVLKVKFGRLCSYHDFMWILDQVRLFEVKRFALIEDQLYVIPDRAPVIEKHETIIEPLTFDMPATKDVAKKAEPTQWEIFKKELSYQWGIYKWKFEQRFEYLFYDQKQNRIFAYGFLLLIAIPCILKIRRHAKTKHALYDTSGISA